MTRKIWNDSKGYVIIFIIVMFFLGGITLWLFLQDPYGSQRTLFFPDQDDYFMDFFNTLHYVADRNPYVDGYGGLVNRNYLPLGYMILYPFSQVDDFANMLPKDLRIWQGPMIACFVFLLLSLGSFFYLMYEGKKGRRVERLFTTLACALSGIILYNIDRANTVILSATALLFFLLFYKDEKPVYRHLAYMALAIAGALKVYPALFGVLLLYEKRIKDAAYAILYGLTFVFLPFLFFQGGFSNISSLFYNVSLNSAKYYGGTFSVISNTIFEAREYYHIGFMVGNIVLILVLLLGWAQKRSWKQILLLTCGLVLTPVHSGYYCGLYLFIPFLFFINEKDHKITDLLYLVFFILILNPLQYSFFLPESSLLVEKIDNYMVSNMAVIFIYILLILETLIQTGKVAFGSRRQNEE